MDNKNSYFYISGFISLSLFIFFLVLFVLLVASPNNIQNFAMKKDNYISVSIDIPDIKQTSSEKNIKQPVIESTQTPKKSEDVNVDDLFSDVWTKSVKKSKQKPKKVDTRRFIELQKKIRKSKNKEVESLSKKVKSIENKKLDIENTSTSTALEVNEYLAKIQAIVYDNFYPPQNSHGNSVKAVIVLSSIGKVDDFRIFTYSSNTELNRECDKIKERLMSVVFPQHPDNVSGAYKITLTSKE